MSSSNCRFLNCIQIFQEAGQVVWYSHLFQNFPQFVVIHTVKGFGVVNEADLDVFLEFSCFVYNPTDVGNLISGSSAFSKSNLNIWKFLVHVLLKPSLENFEHYFASMWNKCNYAVVRTFFDITLLWDSKTDLFQSCDHCWVFQICWHIECSTLTTSSFRIWNSSAGIRSPPLALFVVMLPESHLTSHSKISGSMWVIRPLWLPGSLRSFLYSSSVYSGHLYPLLPMKSTQVLLSLNFPLISVDPSHSNPADFHFFFRKIWKINNLLTFNYTLQPVFVMNIRKYEIPVNIYTVYSA